MRRARWPRQIIPHVGDGRCTPIARSAGSRQRMLNSAYVEDAEPGQLSSRRRGASGWRGSPDARSAGSRETTLTWCARDAVRKSAHVTRPQGCSMTEYTYVDPADDEPVPVHVAFTEDETRRIYAIAEWYAAYCAQHGRAAPVDPMRALLEAAESMGARLEYISAAYEHAQWQADGGETH